MTDQDLQAALADSAAINEAADYHTMAAKSPHVARRRKTWDECSPDEKLERLRECVRSKDMAIAELREQVARLMHHSHSQNGELLGPLYLGFENQCASRRYDPLA